MNRDERGVTAPLEYVYTFAIAAILVTGLIIAATNAASDQRKRTVEAQMEVVAQQVAGNLEAMDRMVQSVEVVPVEYTITRDLPDELLGGSYTVTITETGSGATVTVQAVQADDDLTVQAELDDDTGIAGGEEVIDGGGVRFRYGTGNIVITNV